MTQLLLLSLFKTPHGALSFQNQRSILSLRINRSASISNKLQKQYDQTSRNIIRVERSFQSNCNGYNNNNNYNNNCNYNSSEKPQSRFLDEVEESIQNVFQGHNIDIPIKSRIDNIDTIIETIHPSSQRESVGVAINLYNRIHSLMKNGDCRRCWFQAAHCICDKIPSLEKSNSKRDYNDNHNRYPLGVIPKVHRLFLLTHHKEIGMAVDTAKLILACFENTCRLVVGGIDGEYQSSMKELHDAVQQKERRCMVLFPSEESMTYSDLKRHVTSKESDFSNQVKIHNDSYDDEMWDVIVIDGTWSQARKLFTKYIPTSEESKPFQVCLSSEAVRILDGNDVSNDARGKQLRRHPIKWREVSTLEATRLLIRDIMNEEMIESGRNGSNELPCYDILANYQIISDAAAKKQLGPPRIKSKR